MLEFLVILTYLTLITGTRSLQFHKAFTEVQKSFCERYNDVASLYVCKTVKVYGSFMPKEFFICVWERDCLHDLK